MADELEIPIHMHVHETREEVKQGLSQYGDRPFERLDALGLVTPALMAVNRVARSILSAMEAENLLVVLLDTTASIRFVPDADYHGTAGNLSFRAWDQTDGNSSGDTGIDVSTSGGTTAITMRCGASTA